jgi:hypothetical protein
VTGAFDASPVLPGESTPSPAVAAVRVTWPADIARDPFSSDLVFPRAAPPPGPKGEPVTAPATDRSDVAAMAREKIQLKGTVLGDRPLAMMNGRVYRVGEYAEGFKIVQIETNQITVERDGSRVVVEAH